MSDKKHNGWTNYATWRARNNRSVMTGMNMSMLMLTMLKN